MLTRQDLDGSASALLQKATFTNWTQLHAGEIVAEVTEAVGPSFKNKAQAWSGSDEDFCR